MKSWQTMPWRFQKYSFPPNWDILILSNSYTEIMIINEKVSFLSTMACTGPHIMVAGSSSMSWERRQLFVQHLLWFMPVVPSSLSKLEGMTSLGLGKLLHGGKLSTLILPTIKPMMRWLGLTLKVSKNLILGPCYVVMGIWKKVPSEFFSG